MGVSNRPQTVSLTVLLGLLIAERGIYQIAVPATKPADPDAIPPTWHQALEYVGLFLFYFAAVFALALVVRELRHVMRERTLALPFRIGMALAGTVFLACALLATFRPAMPTEQFIFEAGFTAMLFFLVLSLANRNGSIRIKLGVLLLIAPFFVHFYGPLMMQLVKDKWMDETFPDRLTVVGQWTLLVCGIVSPFCFSPRPVLETLRRPGPMFAAALVACLAAVILRQNYEVGMELASRGLGIEMGPAPPSVLIAMCVVALAGATWTLIACLTADHLPRRQVGLCIGIVFAAGYAFVWPLQYLVSAVGLLALGELARNPNLDVDDCSSSST